MILIELSKKGNLMMVCIQNKSHSFWYNIKIQFAPSHDKVCTRVKVINVSLMPNLQYNSNHDHFTALLSCSVCRTFFYEVLCVSFRSGGEILVWDHFLWCCFFKLRNGPLALVIKFGRRRILTPESSAPLSENRTHGPPRSSSDALTTELLEALWRAGSKFSYS